MNKTKINKFFGRLPLHLVIIVILIIWIVPTLGLFVTSFRPVADINRSGWWTVFRIGQGEETAEQISSPRLTLSNYIDAIVGYRGRTSYLEDCAAGTQAVDLHCNAKDLLNPRGMGRALLNSLMVTLPATFFPILFATFAGYAFAWLHFKGRILLFAILVGLQVVPLQMTLVPISRLYAQLGMNGTLLAVWLFHTGFGMPYAIYLMRNYLGSLPRDLFESAYIDGASHWTAFLKLVIPLAVPALASLAIFQFLWVWNDLLVALVFLGGTTPVLTYQISNMVTSLGAGWHLLTAAAFLSMLLPMIVFFALQRYFVRGMLAGAVKG
jgi:alpha-glucoside transport system permease protein